MVQIYFCSECKREFKTPKKIPYIDDEGFYEGCPFCHSNDIEQGEILE